MTPSKPTAPHPNAYLWVQATIIKSIRSLVPIVLDFKSNVFPKWQTFFTTVITTYALEDHLTTATPPTNTTWLWLDAMQEDRSIYDYVVLQKSAADALAEVGASVSDSDLVTNVIKGLHEHFDSVANISPLLTLFLTFLNFRNMLLLQEMKVVCPSASAFVAKASASPSSS
ncbi:hypothetical protein QYE76_041019 [Lolium multiflorum]|uniref:Uncharacterized protein n=1 Tax=Lolium multiflorum TaxID=4521 RepID=A0AAD8TEI1_LOLMU|nr:hypothetical protein QYE76_041019 [Lolium multiflorum]